MLKIFKRFSPTGLQIGAIDNRWTSCKEEDVPKVAREVVTQLSQILKKPNLDPDLKEWATNLYALAQQRLDRRQ